MSDKKDDPLYQEVMEAGWYGCVHWAIGEPEIRAQFEAETGNRWVPATTPLDRMIDEATGATNSYMKAFTIWATRNLWGEPDGVPEDIASQITDWPEIVEADD